MSAQPDSLKSIFYALAANFSIAVAKFIAAGVTNSGSMMAEAIHSLADTTNQILLLIGLKRAKRPPSADFPLGYGKEIYFWSFIVAILLFSVGGLFSIYEGLHKLDSPEPLNSPLIAVAVLVFAIVAEGLSLAFCIRQINKIRGDKNLWRWFRESRRSELVVVFGEDVAALAGLMMALVAILLTMATGDPSYDAFGSLAIGGLLILVAILIGVEIKALLIGQGVEPEIRAEMLSHIERHPAVKRVFNMLTYQLGADVMVAVKAEMAQVESATALIENINLCERSFKEAFPQVVWLFFEPDHSD